MKKTRKFLCIMLVLSVMGLSSYITQVHASYRYLDSIEIQPKYEGRWSGYTLTKNLYANFLVKLNVRGTKISVGFKDSDNFQDYFFNYTTSYSTTTTNQIIKLPSAAYNAFVCNHDSYAYIVVDGSSKVNYNLN